MSLTKKVYLTISGYDIKLSDNLTFYQKDQLKLIFYINEYGIDYENNATTRALMPVNPLNAILFIENPDGVDSVSSARIEDNAVTFYLDSTHTQYVGVSRMQLRLFDQDGCAITLPHFTFEIRENIYGSGDVRFQNVVMVDQTGAVILTEDNDLLDVGDILTMGTEVAYPQVTKTIKELPIKHGLDGTEKLIVEDNEATKQAPLGTIVDEIKQNSQEKIREIESDLAQTNAQLSANINEVYIECFSGNTDNEKLNKALTYLSESGGTIVLKNREYQFDSFELKDNIVLSGSGGTVLKPISDLNSPLIHIKGNNCTIKDIYISDNGLRFKGITVGDYGSYSGSGVLKNISILNVNIDITKSKNPAIQIGKSINTLVENCRLVNSKASELEAYSFGVSIHSDDSNDNSYVVVKDNYIFGFYDGVKSYGTGNRKGLLVKGNTILNCSNYGIDGYHAMRSRILYNRIENCKNGIYFDSGTINGDNGLGNICAHNQIYNCENFGIKTEELHNGQVSNNTIQGCDVGIVFGGGSIFSSLSCNSIAYNRIGILSTNEYHPELIQSYYNTNNKIHGNFIFANKEHGIQLKGTVSTWSISNNDIVCNNTINGDYYGIYIEPDVFGSIKRNPQSFIINNNNIINNTEDGRVTGYQRGIKIATGNYSRCSLLGNVLNNVVEEIYLYYGNAEVVGNIILSSAPSNISHTTIRAVGNIGLYDGNLVTDSFKGIRLNEGIDATESLPTANESMRGRILRQNRNTDGSSGDKYYICKRNANNTYNWVEIFI